MKKVLKLYTITSLKSNIKLQMKSNVICVFSHALFNKEIFWYLGKNANPEERKAAMKTAEGFIAKMGYPSNSQVRFSNAVQLLH